jgi:hypothetical protein
MVIGLPLATVMGFRRESTPAVAASDRQQNAAFGDELRAVISESANRAASSGESVRITVSERQDPNGAAGSRQYVIAVDPATGSESAEESAPPPPAEGGARRTSSTDWIPPVPAAAGGSVHDLENPIPRVQELLRGLGLEPASMSFALLDDVLTNPLGGGHVNHLMRVQTANGRREDYAVEYILRNPSITAHEIASLSRLPIAPEHLRGL